jgi:type I restriction enzyme S subunit
VNAKPKENGHSCPLIKGLENPSSDRGAKRSKFPSGWPLKPISQLFETQLGKMLSEKARGGDDPKLYLRNKNVQWGYIEVIDILRMDFDEREKVKFRLVPGDLLVCEGGVVGRAALWKGEIAECYYQKALHRLRPLNGAITNEFMLYWLRFAFEIQNFYGISGASSTIAHLPAAQLRALEVPLPPLPEQKKIAHILSTVQQAIEAQEQIIQTTTELKKALMHKLFTEGLRNEPQKQTEIGLIPKTWKVVKLGEIFDTQLGKMLSQKARTGSDPKPYLRNKNVQWRNIDTTDLLLMDFDRREEAKFTLLPGDLLVCEGGQPGRAAIWRGQMQQCYYQKALHRLRPKDKRISNDFLLHWLELSIRYQNTYKLAGASTIAHLPEVQLKALPIPLPPANEQVAIVECLDRLDIKEEYHSRKRDLFQDLFRTLLHELMTAKIRMNQLNYVPYTSL